MRGTAAAGNVHAKTGSFTGVSALAGYVTASDGRPLVFAMITNNVIGSSSRRLEDAVAVRLAGDRAAQPAPEPRTIQDTSRQGGNLKADLQCTWVKAC
jgi:D-alanyl-D-alanine carboxypeptidase/D-alanyl-D-alanine-endopeptidase (penicillin-binding protein 4)